MIIDNLEAELGALDVNAKAKNLINRVLFDVFDSRQGKLSSRQTSQESV
ncbi:AAA ATPase (plasmid) [Bacillus cereus H3081.97]|nr:AAA ATPase [Bacillus cereus H3081.97]BAL21320.1 conserved hypothetical protein [Bacillus cereus NC7401]